MKSLCVFLKTEGPTQSACIRYCSLWVTRTTVRLSSCRNLRIPSCIKWSLRWMSSAENGSSCERWEKHIYFYYIGHCKKILIGGWMISRVLYHINEGWIMIILCLSVWRIYSNPVIRYEQHKGKHSLLIIHSVSINHCRHYTGPWVYKRMPLLDFNVERMLDNDYKLRWQQEMTQISETNTWQHSLSVSQRSQCSVCHIIHHCMRPSIIKQRNARLWINLVKKLHLSNLAKNSE